MRLKNGGTTTVTVSLKSDPSIQTSIQVNAFYDLSYASVYYVTNASYTGKPITFSPTVTFQGKTLTENTDYTVSFSNNILAGTASFSIQGLGLYQGTCQVNFTISKASMRNVSISLPQSQYTWTGEAITPKPTLTWLGKTLEEGTDYTLSWNNNIDHGNATVTATGKGNFSGSVSQDFYISKITITTATISPIDPVTYNGQPFTPEPTVTLNGEILQKDRDYRLEYSNNIDASGSSYYSKARVRIIGMGKYFSERTQVFTILPLEISGETIRFPELSYSGSNPSDYMQKNLSIQYNGTVLTYDTDYRLSASANSSTQEISYLTILFQGNYSGTRTFVSLKDHGRFSSIPDQTYTGAPITPAISIYYGRDLVEGEDYTLTWSDNVNPGTATVTITGKNSFFSSRTLSFKIIKEESETEPKETETDKKEETSSGTSSGNTDIKDPDSSKPGSDTSGGNTDTKEPDSSKPGSGTSDNGNPDSKPGNGTPGGNTDTKEPDSPKPGSGTSSDIQKPVSLKNPTLKGSVSWNKVTLRWNPVANAKGYIIYRKTGSGKYVKLKTLTSKNARTYSDTRVSVGSTYRYVIKAYTTDTSSQKIYSGLSKAVLAKPALTRPVITLRSLSGKQRITWKKVSGATGYFLYQKTGSGSYRKIKTLTSRNTSWTVRTRKGVTYSYKLVPYRKVNKTIKTGPASLIKKAKAR